MLSINLLPIREREAVWLEETRRIVFFFAALVVIVLVIGSILLIPSFLTLFSSQRELTALVKKEERVSEDLGVEKILAKAKNTRSSVRSLKEYLVETPRAAVLLESLLSTVTSAIVLSGLEVKKSGEVKLTGAAATRQDLLGFEKRLRDSELLQGISFPISNIIKETDINFIMQGKVKERRGL